MHRLAAHIRAVALLVLVAGLLLAPGVAAADHSATHVVENTTETVTDTVDDTTDTTSTSDTDTVSGTTSDVTDTVENTTDTVTGTVDDTTDDVTDSVDNTTDTVSGTVENTTDTVTRVGETVTQSGDEETYSSPTIRLLERGDVTNFGFVGIDTNVGPNSPLREPDATVGLLRGSDGSVGMIGGGPVDDDSPLRERSDSDGAEASIAGPAGGNGGHGTPLPDVPPAGVAAGVGIVGVAGAAILRNGSLVPGSSATMLTRTAASPLVTAGSSLLDRLTRLFAPFRYSRFDDSDPLEHEARVEMVEAIESAPGTYLSEVADHADLPLSTVRHHIKVLEREGLVASAKVRGRRRFYPAAAEGLELAAAMNDEATATLLDALSRLGPSSVSGLAEEMDKDPSTISHHLKRLEEDGIVVRERDGRAIVNRLSEEAAAALEPELEPDQQAEPVAAD